MILAKAHQASVWARLLLLVLQLLWVVPELLQGPSTNTGLRLLLPAITTLAMLEHRFRLHLVPISFAVTHLLHQTGVQAAQPLERWGLILSSLLDQSSLQDRLLQAAAILQMDLGVLLLWDADSIPSGVSFHQLLASIATWGMPVAFFVILHPTVLSAVLETLSSLSQPPEIHGQPPASGPTKPTSTPAAVAGSQSQGTSTQAAQPQMAAAGSSGQNSAADNNSGRSWPGASTAGESQGDYITIHELQLAPSYCMKLGTERIFSAALLLTMWLPVLQTPQGSSVIELHDRVVLALFSTLCGSALVVNGVLAVTRTALFTTGHEVFNTVAVMAHLVCRLITIAVSAQHRTLAYMAESLTVVAADVVVSEYSVEKFIVALLATSSATVAVHLLASSTAAEFSSVMMDWLVKASIIWAFVVVLAAVLYFTLSTGRLRKVPRRYRVARMHAPAATPSTSLVSPMASSWTLPTGPRTTRFSFSSDHTLMYNRAHAVASALAALGDTNAVATALSTVQTSNPLLDTVRSRLSPSAEAGDMQHMLWSTDVSDMDVQHHVIATATTHAAQPDILLASASSQHNTMPSNGVLDLLANLAEWPTPQAAFGSVDRLRYKASSSNLEREEQPTMLGFLAIAAAGGHGVSAINEALPSAMRAGGYPAIEFPHLTSVPIAAHARRSIGSVGEPWSGALDTPMGANPMAQLALALQNPAAVAADGHSSANTLYTLPHTIQQATREPGSGQYTAIRSTPLRSHMSYGSEASSHAKRLRRMHVSGGLGSSSPGSRSSRLRRSLSSDAAAFRAVSKANSSNDSISTGMSGSGMLTDRTTRQLLGNIGELTSMLKDSHQPGQVSGGSREGLFGRRESGQLLGPPSTSSTNPLPDDPLALAAASSFLSPGALPGDAAGLSPLLPQLQHPPPTVFHQQNINPAASSADQSALPPLQPQYQRRGGAAPRGLLGLSYAPAARQHMMQRMPSRISEEKMRDSMEEQRSSAVSTARPSGGSGSQQQAVEVELMRHQLLESVQELPERGSSILPATANTVDSGRSGSKPGHVRSSGGQPGMREGLSTQALVQELGVAGLREDLNAPGTLSASPGQGLNAGAGAPVAPSGRSLTSKARAVFLKALGKDKEKAGMADGSAKISIR